MTSSLCSDAPPGAAHLDDVDRERYVAVRGLTNWDDRSAPRQERGTEHAAFTIQQNLMADDPAPSPRWADPADAYELLTGLPSPVRSSWGSG